METQTHKVLILTVGQTLEPLEFALAEHAPLKGVVFVASQSSYPVAGDLLRQYGGQFNHHTLLINDHEDLNEAYRKGLEALQKALEWDGRPILADISGGTKTMVAGLTLALSGKGVTFSYVGGSQRDAQGRVVSGSERMRLLEDPTQRYGLREWEGFRRAWNGADFRAAQDFLSELLARPLTPSEQRFYTHLKGVAEAMLDWDLFRHKAAWQKLEAHWNRLWLLPKPGGTGPRCGCWRGLRKPGHGSGPFWIRKTNPPLPFWLICWPTPSGGPCGGATTMHWPGSTGPSRWR